MDAKDNEGISCISRLKKKKKEKRETTSALLNKARNLVTKNMQTETSGKA